MRASFRNRLPLALLLGLGLGLATGRSWAQGAPGEAHVHEALPPAAAPAQGRIPTDSIYQLAATWTDQDARGVPLAALKGRPQVVAMMYTTCQYVCPLIVDEMKRVERDLPAEVRAEVGFALFSFDPERDSVPVLKAYAAKRGLDERRWRLYTGAPEDVLELAAVLGVRFRKEPDGEFSHSILITVLDREGVVRYQMVGLNQDRKPLVSAVLASAGGALHPH